MTKSEFLKRCHDSGYCDKKTAEEHAKNKDEFTEDDLIEAITDIVAFNHTLTFNLQTGEKIVKEWQPHSRAKSWTPEMKETARQRALKQRSEK